MALRPRVLGSCFELDARLVWGADQEKVFLGQFFVRRTEDGSTFADRKPRLLSTRSLPGGVSRDEWSSVLRPAVDTGGIINATG